MTAVGSDDFAVSITGSLDPQLRSAAEEFAQAYGLSVAELVERAGLLLLSRLGHEHGSEPIAETSVAAWLAQPIAQDGAAAEPLPLAVTLSPDGQALQYHWRIGAFDHSTIDRLAGHFQTLFAALIVDPAARIGELEILSHTERQQLLVDWNSTAVAHPADSMVHRLIAQQAARTPQATAVIAGEVRLSHQELDQRANRLAHHLQDLGVGPGSLVAVCVQRDECVLVGMLAVLKAGGAYVPLDSETPADRLAFILDDTQATAVITQQALSNRLPSEGVRVVCLDSDWPAIAELPAEEPISEALPDDLAYVIYTSGSTGTPKGVQVTHRNFADFMHSADAAFPPTGRGHGSVLLSSIAFDLPIPSLFLPLMQGESVVIMGQAGADGVAMLAAAFARGESFSTVKLTPSHLEILLERLEGSDVRLNVGTLVVAGEPFGSDLARAAVEKCAPGAVVLNEYGPTETTVGATLYEVDPATLTPGTTLPIGRPMANTEAYVVDRFGRLEPIGIAGELWIGGAGVARGYLGSPELTARSFLPHPFSHDPDARIYRTGDLARWLPDGNIEFLGRSDHQLKIRGHRVELGEIDAAVTACPGVAQAVTVLRQDQPGDKRLVSYVVHDGRGRAVPDVPATMRASLRRFLKQQLPEYMVPNAFVFLEQLPLSANGKIDRQALPEPSGLRAEFDEHYVAPRTDAEHALARIWAEVLGVDRVGVHDHFFDLGGHSLLAMRVVSRIARDLGSDVSVGGLFSHPSVAALAGHLEAANDAAAVEPRRRGPLDRKAPLSFGQQRLWFLHQLMPDSGQLLTHRVVRLTGPVNAEALEAAFAGLIERHEVLRTRIAVASDGQPHQLIDAETGFRLEHRDAHDHDEAVRVVREESARALSPVDGPLIRAVLVSAGADAHLLLLAMHHIVTDDWSVQILAKELGELYSAALTGGEPALPSLPVQYADFAVWERQRLGGERLKADLDYWRAQLADTEPLELPTDRVRPPQRTGNGASVEFAVPDAVTRALSQLARRTSVTPFMVQLAAFQLFLGKYSGQDDIAVGIPTAGRYRSETESLIGFFVNTLVMRADMSDDPTFEELLHRVRDVAQAAYAHQDLPFERLVEELAPERDLSRTPLFQAMLTPQNLAAEVWSFPGLEAEAVDTGTDAAQFDLTLVLQESGETLRGLLSYSTDLFDRATAERMAGHFQNLLARAVETPTARLSELELLGEADRHQLLVEWNDTAHEMPAESVPALFERQVAQTPNASALIHDDSEWTYRELNERVNRIAHLLIERGVGPGDVVALALPKSADLIAALLAAAKTGAAYLPIDTGYPAERIRYMIEDAEPACVLTDTTVRYVLPDGPPSIALDAPEWAATLAACSADNPTADQLRGPVTQDIPFYVMYTSGSTGRPKGVVMPGRGLINLTSWLRKATPGEPNGRIAQFATISFDIAPYEILSALLYGKCLVVAPESIRIDPVALVKWMECYEIHELNAPNLVLEEFYRAADASRAVLPELRVIAQGGDTHVLGDSARAFHARHPWCVLHNGYGPTETHGVTDHMLPTDVGLWPGIAPIGVPVGNTRLYVLDRHRRLVPPGVPGELYASGVGVAHGYLNRPELTNQRFLPDPYGPEGARMYRTGDLVRWLPDGTLEFLGRIDKQVKVRGIRIELGEIESVLMEHPDMASCVVVDREDGRGGKRLAAYCVPLVGRQPETAALREWCGRRLPEYMVPSAFTLLDRLPLTTNKKVDHKALPAPERDLAETAARYTEPHTPVEEIVAEVWADVLGVSRVGIHDNFFELGGHSLLAMRVVNGLAGRLKADVPVRELFAHPTVAGFAGRLEALSTEMVPLLPREAGAPVPLSFGQQRLWFLDQLLTDSAEYLLPVVLRLQGDVDAGALEKAFAELMARHEVLRTRFVAGADGEPRQVVDEPSGFLLETPDGAPDPWAVVRDEAYRPMDLASGPLLRAVLVRVTADEHLLLMVVHHIVSDGWSMRVIARELPLLYAAAVHKRPADLAPLPVQYGDFALWQRGQAAGASLEPQLSYWRRTLAGLEPLELPTDRVRPPVRSSRGASVEFEVPGDVLQGLRYLARAEDCTLFMVLLALFQVLLSRYSGQSDVAVGVPIAGRNRAETEGLIGFFVNTLVMRADLSGEPTVREVLARTRDRALEAYGNQDVPFERLVEELAPERDLSRTPLFQVMLSLQEDHRWEPFEGLAAKSHPLESATAALDMSVSIQEHGDCLAARVEYSTDLFDRTTVERLAGHFAVLLGAAVAEPDARIGMLDILTDAERGQLLAEWNATKVPYPVGRAVPDLFEERVRECPGAVAVVFGDRSLTYGELNARA
ncbi:amino acid adenylation domain-containing protein, partial [Streptomyces sp. NPDC048737]|uniref:amino acid adenylation domain-containing protein n=1 Tax=Streptomyces sp. NPDC048737 TaxID=3155764 RepID=UPI003448270C